MKYISDNIIAIPFDKKSRIVFNKFFPHPFLIRKDEIRKQRFSKTFHDKKLWFHARKEERHLINQFFKRELEDIKRFKTNSLGVYLTDECNMNCIYCLRSKSNDKNDVDMDSIRQSIDFFLAHNGNKIASVHFTGGEPLLKADVIEKIIIHIMNSIDNTPYYYLNTNGTLFSDNIARLLKKYGIKISISIDGNEEIHNDNRKIGPYGTFAKIKENLGEFKNAAIPIESALVTINNNSLKMDIEQFLSLLIAYDIKTVAIQIDKFERKNIFAKLNFIGDLIIHSNKYGIKCRGEFEFLVKDFIRMIQKKEAGNTFFSSKCSAHNFKMINIDYKGKIRDCCYSPAFVRRLDEYEEYVDSLTLTRFESIYMKNPCFGCIYYTFCTAKCNSTPISDAECSMKKLYFSIFVSNKKNIEYLRTLLDTISKSS